MKKQIAIASAIIALVAALCFCTGRYYFINRDSGKIEALEIPPYSDEIVITEGEYAYEKFFEVISTDGFFTADISFESTDPSVAVAKYGVTDRNRYVCYKVEGRSAGETYIYFTAEGGKVSSEMIKVTVLPKKEDVTTITATASPAETITEPESTKVTQHEEPSSIEESVTHTEKETQPHTESVTETTQQRGNTVYITPTGKRYHYSKSCAGKNARAVSKSDATGGGKTPCKKCAGG